MNHQTENKMEETNNPFSYKACLGIHSLFELGIGAIMYFKSEILFPGIGTHTNLVKHYGLSIITQSCCATYALIRDRQSISRPLLWIFSGYHASLTLDIAYNWFIRGDHHGKTPGICHGIMAAVFIATLYLQPSNKKENK